MSRRFVLSVIFFSVVAGLLIGYVRGLPDDFVDGPADALPPLEYGYRCGDGTEFTLVPDADGRSVRIVPATSVDYVRERVLEASTNTPGTVFGSGVTVRAHGTVLELLVPPHATTTCTSMTDGPVPAIFHY